MMAADAVCWRHIECDSPVSPWSVIQLNVALNGETVHRPSLGYCRKCKSLGVAEWRGARA